MPSPLEVLLDLKEDMGKVKAGIEISLENDREIFAQVHETRDRVTTLEARLPMQAWPAPAPPSVPDTAVPSSVRPGLLSSLTEFLRVLKEVLPSLKELALAAALLVLAIRGLTAPEALLTALGLGK